MVIKEADFYFNSIMKNLNDLRKDELIFDVRVVYGDKEIPAHKCILVASSDYFKSLFLGPVKTNSDKVDLSSVALDFDSVEAVIDFLYTGKIDINDENLEALLVLSSFLLLTDIEDLCESYIKDCKSLDSYFSFYLLSENYVLDEDLSDYVANTVQSRFHDFFIFKDSVREMDEFYLKQLMQTYNIFEHCDASDILSFIEDWLLSGNTETHEQLGMEILEIVEVKMNKDGLQKTQHRMEQLREKLGTDEKYPKFKDMLDQIIDRNMCGKLADIGVDGAKPETEKVGESLPNDSEQSDAEEVVIGFAPKRRLKDFLKSTNRRETCEGDSAIFDLCVYVPRDKRWYYLTEGPNRSVFKRIGERNCDPTGPWPWLTCSPSLKETFESDWTLNFCTMECICCVSPHESKIYMYRLQTHVWEFISYQQLVSTFPDFDNASDVRVCCRNGNQLVMVLRKLVLDDDSDYKISFRCYTRDTQQSSSWNFLFQTSNMEHTEHSSLKGGKFDVGISQDGKQLYIINGGDSIQMIVANLGTPTPELKQVHVGSNWDDINTDHVWVLQNEEQVYAVEQKYYDDPPSMYYKCRQANKVYEPDFYMYMIDGYDEMTLETSYPEEDNPDCSLEKIVCSARDGKYLWVITGDGKFGSTMDSIFVNRDGEMKQIQHSPPPFSTVTTIAAGTVRREHIAHLQPIKCFLED